MDYELAKQLKDAGFPKEHFLLLESEDYPERNTYAGAPTLSELIEACGEAMQMLYQTTDTPDSSVIWVARTAIGEPSGEGKTPEESVARLWLQLNIKS